MTVKMGGGSEGKEDSEGDGSKEVRVDGGQKKRGDNDEEGGRRKRR